MALVIWRQLHSNLIDTAVLKKDASVTLETRLDTDLSETLNYVPFTCNTEREKRARVPGQKPDTLRTLQPSPW